MSNVNPSTTVFRISVDKTNLRLNSTGEPPPDIWSILRSAWFSVKLCCGCSRSQTGYALREDGNELNLSPVFKRKRLEDADPSPSEIIKQENLQQPPYDNFSNFYNYSGPTKEERAALQPKNFDYSSSNVVQQRGADAGLRLDEQILSASVKPSSGGHDEALNLIEKIGGWRESREVAIRDVGRHVEHFTNWARNNYDLISPPPFSDSLHAISISSDQSVQEFIATFTNSELVDFTIQMSITTGNIDVTNHYEFILGLGGAVVAILTSSEFQTLLDSLVPPSVTTDLRSRVTTQLTDHLEFAQVIVDLNWLGEAYHFWNTFNQGSYEVRMNFLQSLNRVPYVDWRDTRFVNFLKIKTFNNIFMSRQIF